MGNIFEEILIKNKDKYKVIPMGINTTIPAMKLLRNVENSDLWRSSGRGLQLINAYMDEVKYEVTGVTMVKHIS